MQLLPDARKTSIPVINSTCQVYVWVCFMKSYISNTQPNVVSASGSSFMLIETFAHVGAIFSRYACSTVNIRAVWVSCQAEHNLHKDLWHMSKTYNKVIAERNSTKTCCQFWTNQNTHDKNECNHNLVGVTHKLADCHLYTNGSTSCSYPPRSRNALHVNCLQLSDTTGCHNQNQGEQDGKGPSNFESDYWTLNKGLRMHMNIGSKLEH